MTMIEMSAESWVASLYVLAFIRAGMALIALISGYYAEGTGGWALVDVVGGIVLGVAAYQRHLWAGYALIIYAALDSAMKLLTYGAGTALLSLLWVAFFITGTVHLFRSKDFTSPVRLDIPFIIKWSCGILVIGFISGFLRTFNPALLKQLLGVPGSLGRSWTITVAAYGLILGSLILAVRSKRSWTLEHVLGIGLVVSLWGILTDLFVGSLLIHSLVGSLYLFGLAFLAWGISEKLKPAIQGKF